jgi:threonine synthase
MVVLATAHPAKFPEIVREAIGRDVPLPEGLARAMELDEQMLSVAPRLGAIVEAVDSLDGEES